MVSFAAWTEDFGLFWSLFRTVRMIIASSALSSSARGARQRKKLNDRKDKDDTASPLQYDSAPSLRSASHSEDICRIKQFLGERRSAKRAFAQARRLVVVLELLVVLMAILLKRSINIALGDIVKVKLASSRLLSLINLL
ncbi:hypothetical protein KCU83_g580, partial [Aureobasidium melanogenum]